MHLHMYLDKNFIESIRIDHLQVIQPGYLGNQKRRLMEKHSTLLEQACSEPEFLITLPADTDKAAD